MNTDTNLPVELEQNVHVRDNIMETIVGSKSTYHRPIVYSLPKNSTLQAPPQLTSSYNINDVHLRLANDICSIFGIPFEMVGRGFSNKQSVTKSTEFGRIFTTNMVTVCKHLQNLLADVYVAAYGGLQEDVQFMLFPSPRLEIKSVEDLTALMEAGVVSRDNAYAMSNMILGLDLKHGSGESANAGQFSKVYQTPQQKLEVKKVEIAEKAATAKRLKTQ